MEGDEARALVDGNVEEGYVAVAHQDFGIVFDSVVIEEGEESSSAVAPYCAEDGVNFLVLEKCHDFLGAVFVGCGHETCLQHVPCRVSELDVVSLFCEEVDSGFERERVRVAGRRTNADCVSGFEPWRFDDLQAGLDLDAG